MKQPTHAIFSREKFVERMFGDEAFARRIACSALRDLEHNFEGLKDALRDDDDSQILFFLHGIKGVAGNAHCDALFELSRELELKARAGEMTECLAAMDELLELVEETRKALEAYLNAHDN